jgi:diketogulonate reductase-like aldo/keto reductase
MAKCLSPFFWFAAEIEYHPYVLASLDPILSICKANDIRIEAYGPLTPLLRHPSGGPIKPILSRIANRLSSATGKEIDEAGVLLLWTRAKGAVAISSSKNEGNIKKLVDVGRLPENTLTEDEVKEIETEGRKVHFRNYDEHLTVDYAAPDLPQDI